MRHTDKAFGMLWVVYLESGPDVPLIRFRVAAIRSFTTDRGTEVLLPDTCDLLGPFLVHIGCDVECTPTRWLFPRCAQINGWQHLWDSMLQQVLNQLPGWPDWFAATKKAVKLLRWDTYRHELAREAKS